MTRLHKILRFLGVAFVLVLAFGISVVYNERTWRIDMVRQQATLLYKAAQRHDTQAINELANPQVAHWLAAQDALMGPVKDFHLDGGYAEIVGIPAGVDVTVKRTKGEQAEDVSDWGQAFTINAAGVKNPLNQDCRTSLQCNWPEY